LMGARLEAVAVALLHTNHHANIAA
jgi:hypothetical protein